MLKCASFFAGVGGIDLGFENAGFQCVYANEIDTYAANTYEKNFSIQVDRRCVRKVEVSEIPDFDVMLSGFPCQAFSIAGYRQGFDDEQGRGNLFFEMVRILKAKKPRFAFFENVKNMVGHDDGKTFSRICQELENLGYRYKFNILNACEYGNVPQNRERIYIVAFRNNSDYEKFEFPEKLPLNKKINDVVGLSDTVDEKYYYTAEKCKFYDQLVETITSSETAYQWRRKYVRENKSQMLPTLTANMGTGGHNVPLILTTDKRIRKLTPKECFNAQGFPRDFIIAGQSNTQLYKQAGNSVSVPVITRIAENLQQII